jgi:hypothetical protein
MRVLSAILWSMIGTVVGAIEGGTFGWTLEYTSVETGVQVGAALGLIAGLIYGFLAKKDRFETRRLDRARVFFERCAWCQGSGWEDKKRRRRCESCEGEGRVVVAAPSYRCPRCRGKGRSFPRRKCKLCEGTGWEAYSLFKPVARLERKLPIPKRWPFLRLR